jgi:hypothetical protein
MLKNSFESSCNYALVKGIFTETIGLAPKKLREFFREASWPTQLEDKDDWVKS